MLYREIIAVCSQIHKKHINTLCGQNVELCIKIQAVPLSKHSPSRLQNPVKAGHGNEGYLFTSHQQQHGVWAIQKFFPVGYIPPSLDICRPTFRDFHWSVVQRFFRPLTTDAVGGVQFWWRINFSAAVCASRDQLAQCRLLYLSSVSTCRFRDLNETPLSTRCQQNVELSYVTKWRVTCLPLELKETKRRIKMRSNIN